MTPVPTPGSPPTSTVDHGLTRDGLMQLRRRWRPPEPPTAAILLVHGITEHSGRYEHVGRWLADAGFDVVAIDARGAGESGGRRSYVDRFDDFVDDVEDQLVEVRRLGVPVVLLGHSMGGLIALDLATSDRPQPDLVVVSGPALGAQVPLRLRLLAPLAGRLAPRLRMPSPVDVTTLSRDPAVGERYLADPLVNRFVTARLGWQVLERGAQVVQRLDRLRVPVLVLHGEDDRLVPPAASEPLQGLPGVTREVLPGLRHEILNEPEHPQVLARIADWIESSLARA